MSGSPFMQLKEACLGIAEKIFGANGEQSFENTTVCFFENNANDFKVTNDIETYKNYI